MVWETFCIVFIWVIVIHFYPKSCNSICVLSLFSEKSCKLGNKDITWNIEDMKMEVQWSYKIFEDNTKWRKFISSSKASQDERMGEKGLNTTELVQEGLPHAPLCMKPRVPAHESMRPLSWTRPGSVVFLFSKPFLVENPIFTLLTPK